jgi:hypothetical protein
MSTYSPSKCGPDGIGMWVQSCCLVIHVQMYLINRPRWPSGSVLATGSKVRGFKPG